jgi:hypothetical protein
MKRVCYVAIFVALLITLISMPRPTYAQASQGEAACPQQNDPLCTLAQRYRPFLRYSQDKPKGSGTLTSEPHHPTSWQWWFTPAAQNKLASYVVLTPCLFGDQICEGSYENVAPPFYPNETAASLMSATGADMRVGLNAQQTPYLAFIPYDETGEDWTSQYTGDYNAMAGDGIYAHVEPINADLVNIEYWILYAYNEGLNNGECEVIADLGNLTYDHNGDLDFGVDLVYSRAADAAGLGADGIIRATFTQHGKEILMYDLTSSSQPSSGTWSPPGVDILDGGSYNYVTFYQINNAYESQFCTAYIDVCWPFGCNECLEWFHSACSWDGTPPDNGGSQVTFVQDPVSLRYDHIALWAEWGSHEPWPASCGSSACMPAHTGNGPAYLPSQVAYLGTLSYLMSGPDYQENAPFAFFNGQWGDNPDPMMLHNEWYYPFNRAADPCGSENPWGITSARGFDDSGNGWSNPYCVSGCSNCVWTPIGSYCPTCNQVSGGAQPYSMPWPPQGDTSWYTSYKQPVTATTLNGPTYSNNGVTYISGKTTVNFNVVQDATFNNTTYGAARTYYKVYPGGTPEPPFPFYGPPPPFALPTGPLTLTPPDGAYQLYYYSVDVLLREAQMESTALTLDTTPPVITITQPAAVAYPHSATLVPNFGANDGLGSGVASVIATIDGMTTIAGQVIASGTPIILDNLALGAHTFTVTAIDHVGNKSSASVKFTLVRINTQCQIFVNPPYINGKTKVVLTADVTPIASVPGAPTGKVAFWDSDFHYSDTDLGSAPLVNDQATLTVTLVPKPNPQFVRAVYAEDQNFFGCVSQYVSVPQE